MCKTVSVITENEQQTKKVSASLTKAISAPAIFAITGQLGAGKTQFVKGLGEGLNLNSAQICSASFVVIAEYGQSPTLIHIDAYRLRHPQELIEIGWDEIIERNDVIVAIEWAQKISSILPDRRIDVNIEIIEGEKRKITLTAKNGADIPEHVVLL